MSWSTRASIVGVATPVEDMVTMVSMAPASTPAPARAAAAHDRNMAQAPSTKAALRSGQPWGARNQS